MAPPDVHVHIKDKRHDDGEVLALLHTILANQETIMADLSGIQNAVAGLTSVVDSAVEFMTQLADTIRNTEPSQAALNDLAASVEAAKTELADAIVANTEAIPHPDQTLPGDLPPA